MSRPLEVQGHQIVQRSVGAGGTLIHCVRCAKYATKVIRADGFPKVCSGAPEGRGADMDRLTRGMHPDRHKNDFLGPQVSVSAEWRQVLMRRVREVAGVHLNLQEAEEVEGPRRLTRAEALSYYGVTEATVPAIKSWATEVRERRRRDKAANNVDPEASESDASS